MSESQEKVWRCTTCRKIKPLSGSHLNGKTEVRSDCWPCAKKRTFKLEEATVDPSEALGSQNISEPAKAFVAAKTEKPLVNPFAVQAASPSVFASPPNATPANPFQSPAPAGAKSNPFATPSIASSSAQAPAMKNPFSFGQGPAAAKLFEPSSKLPQSAGPSPSNQQPEKPAAPSPNVSASQPVVWRCVVCKKVKALEGPHLEGKDSVRSDCWPCAKKREFRRDGAPSTGSTPPVSPDKPTLKGTATLKEGLHSAPNSKGGVPISPTLSFSPPKPASQPQPTTGDVWRCVVCNKAKPLEGSHLEGKDTVRSDCWPCAKKREFKRFKSGEAPQLETKPAQHSKMPSFSLPAASAPSPASFNLSSAAASQKSGAPSAFAFPSAVATPPNSDGSAQSLNFGFGAPPAARSAVVHWVTPTIPSCPPPAVSDEIFLRAFVNASFKKTADVAPMARGTRRHYVQIPPQMDVGAIAHAVAFCASAVDGPVVVCTHDLQSFSAISTYRGMLDEVAQRNISVYGPAFDITQQKTELQDRVEAYGGKGVTVSVDAKNEAMKRVYSSTFWACSPTSCTGEAIAQQINTEKCFVIVTVGPAMAWSDLSAELPAMVRMCS